VDNAIHWINHYSADDMVCFVTLLVIYPLDSVIQPSNNHFLVVLGGTAHVLAVLAGTGHTC